ncbi:MAG TPA: aromatic ring-hydroxylating dioxygenase subunit alpha [Desertimonas sp.]|nr:aromatic ring-hydroxylating dioxygenase subunit alpha [Desertimonas sp.]
MLVEAPALRRYWYVVAEAGDIVDAPHAVRLLGDDVVIWRGPGGTLIAAPDRCPHREAPLSAGHVVDGCLECCYHGWTFGVEGRCVRVPSASAGVPIPPRSHLSTVHVVERYGLVWVCLGDPVAGIPHIAVEDLATYRRINTGVDVWRTSATRMTDNFMDISHFPYVHVGTFGIPDNTLVPKISMEQLDDDFCGYRYEAEVSNESGMTSSGLAAKVITRTMTTGFNLPFTVRSTIRYETGLDHLILLCSTPIDDVTSYFTFVVWRNDDFTVPAEEVIAFDRAIGAEDKTMLERIGGVLPIDQTATVSVQADKPSVEWRRQLAPLLP